jgi:energy-coupling factor transport system permease protein
VKRIYELNFFVKLVGAFLVTALAWLAREPLPSAATAGIVVVGLIVMRVPRLSGYLRTTGLLVLMVIATWCVNLLLQGESFTAALPVAVRMAARLVATTGAFYFVIETSTPGSVLAACSAGRLPPMATLTLSLMFGIVPMLRDELDRIANAQRARGMEIDGVPFYTRLRFALARGVPLLVQAIRMAEAISLSLSLNGYDTRQRRTTWRRVGLFVEPALPISDKPTITSIRQAWWVP